MTELYQVYKCGICGNMVEVVHTGKGQLVCCNKPMELMTENTVDASKEKHVPVVESSGEKTTMKVGSVIHPMEEKHYIEWIEIITKEGNCRRFLKPGDPPEAEFTSRAEVVAARAYCNLHGLWKA